MPLNRNFNNPLLSGGSITKARNELSWGLPNTRGVVGKEKIRRVDRRVYHIAAGEQLCSAFVDF